LDRGSAVGVIAPPVLAGWELREIDLLSLRAVRQHGRHQPRVAKHELVCGVLATSRERERETERERERERERRLQTCGVLASRVGELEDHRAQQRSAVVMRAAQVHVHVVA
jgi:hypothetical protein